jgi:hypothetical protein
VPGNELLAYHVLHQRGGIGFLIAGMGLVGCWYFGVQAVRGLRDDELPAEHTRISVVALVLCVLVVAFGAYVLAELTSPLEAARIFLATGVLVVGIFLAFFVGFGLAAGGSDVLAYALGLVVLAIGFAIALAIVP